MTVEGTTDIARTVILRDGSVRGTIRDGVGAFLGIPYGSIPERFRAATAPEPWDGVLDATRLGAPCIQANPDYPAWTDPEEASEDCLFVNVWTPVRDGGGHLPVMVWVHGGAFVYGSAGAPGYDGAALATAGNVVVVSLNHRLNAFGYLWLGGAFPDLKEDANLGQRDIILALQWVQENIAAFGGDPSNVTLFGESGGGAKIGALLAAPSAAGLFHKGIIQSGSQTRVHSREEAGAITEAFLDELAVADLGSLQTIGADDILAAAGRIEARFGTLAFQPVVDGHHLPERPWEAGVPVLARGIPLIVGTTRDETVSFLPHLLPDEVPSDEAAAHEIRRFPGLSDLAVDDARRLVDDYRRLLPGASGTEIVLAVTRDLWMWKGALVQAQLRLNEGDTGATYVYEFNWGTPCFGSRWAVHAGELPFVFGNLDYPTAWDGADDAASRAADDPEGHRFRLSREMISAWSAFAYTGSPSTPELYWPPFTSIRGDTMVFEREHSRAEPDRDSARRALIADFPAGW